MSVYQDDAAMVFQLLIDLVRIYRNRTANCTMERMFVRSGEFTSVTAMTAKRTEIRQTAPMIFLCEGIPDSVYFVNVDDVALKVSFFLLTVSICIL
jgi:hypothetical protein